MKSRFFDKKILYLTLFSGFFWMVSMTLFTKPAYAGPGEVIHGRVVYTRPDGVDIPINGVQIVAHSEWDEGREKEDHLYTTEGCGSSEVYWGHGEWDQYEDCNGGQYVFTLSCGRPDWKIQVLGLAQGVDLPAGVPPGGEFVPQSQKADVTDNIGISTASHDIRYIPPSSVLPTATPNISISGFTLPPMDFLGIKLGVWPSPTIK